MTDSLYSAIRKAFLGYDKQSRITLNAPNVKIEVTQLSMEGEPRLGEIWFNIKTEKLDEKSVMRAIKLFDESRFLEGGYCFFTSEGKVSIPLTPAEIPAEFLRRRTTLGSLFDECPSLQGFSDVLAAEIDYLPSHRWGRIYCAFEKFCDGKQERGYHWNSLVLHNDGLALRIAKSANFLNTISPALSESSEKRNAYAQEDIDECDSALIDQVTNQLVGELVQKDVQRITENDVLGWIFGRMRRAVEPSIDSSDLDGIERFVKEDLDISLATLGYSTSK